MFLERIREKSKGLVGAIVIGLIAITFALFGIDQYLGGGSAPPVASVNGAKISSQQFQQALVQRQQQMRDMFGGNVPAGILEPETLREPVLQGMIQNELLTQATEKFGYGISDSQVADAIRNIPAFQDNGQFKADKYDRLLAQQRRSKASFEAQLRNGLRLEQFGDVFQSSVFLPARTLKDFVRLRDQTRHLQYVVLDKQAYAAEVSVDSSEIKSYYDKNTAQFMTAERVKLEYLVLDEKALAAQVSIDEQAVRDMFEKESDRFKTAESRQVRQILLKLPESKDVAAIQAVEDEANALYERIKAGEDFATLAKQYSQDDLSREQGGDLGEIFPGDIAPELENVIFSLAAGETGLPVKTQQGVYLVKVDAINGGESMTFDEARPQIEKELRERQAESELVEKSEQLLTLTYEEPGTLAPAADALGISTQTTGWITAAGGEDNLAKEPEILRAAFSNDVLKERKNSDVIGLADGRQVVVRIAEYQASEPEALEVVIDRIETLLADEKQQQLAVAKATEILNTLNEGSSEFSVLASEAGLELVNIEALGRQSSDTPPEIVNQAFKMPLPDAEGSLTTLSLNNGNQAVLKLIAVNNPEVDSTKADDLEMITSVLGGSYGQREMEAVFKAMESRADIEVYRDNFQADQ